MTNEERMEMYREKNGFISLVRNVFTSMPHGHTVSDITYEVWRNTTDRGTITVEWVIVHYNGGAKCPVRVTGNSNTANFRVIGTLLDGGYYQEEIYYDNQFVPDSGWEKLDLRLVTF
jgi:hypothetical protein